MNNIGIMAGTFDPITNGHLNVLRRSFSLCEKVIVAVGTALGKKTLFSIEERLNLTKVACEMVVSNYPLNKFEVLPLEGLLVDLAKAKGAKVIIRGIRSVTDFEYEINLANINSDLNPEIDTIFMPCETGLSIISSSMVKEIAKYNGDISKYVPSVVQKAIFKKMSEAPAN